MKRHPSRRGFTLVEILATMAVSALLAGLAFAGWQRTFLAGKNTQCLANLRAIGVAAAAYSSDNDGALPATAHQRDSWIASLQPYLGTKKPYRCPLDPNPRRVSSYAINDALTPRARGPNFSRRQNIPRPAATMFMAETADSFSGGDHFHFFDEETGEFVLVSMPGELGPIRHSLGSNYLFVDGHVETLTHRELNQRLREADSAFINPNP
ncbi:MAG TPA: prepilin-type N-terminal cleavage/methylation domain-containing protein [Chthoniobacterales bacterium]